MIPIDCIMRSLGWGAIGAGSLIAGALIAAAGGPFIVVGVAVAVLGGLIGATQANRVIRDCQQQLAAAG
jgi:hypothetical protein